jgi:hypothetical protein
MRHGLRELLTDWWWVFLPLIALIMLMKYVRRRNRSDTSSGDILEGDEELGAAPKAGNASAIYPSFEVVLQRIVLPLHQNNPDWERLDGTYGVPGRPVARFDWNGTVYALDSESKIPALLAASDWAAANPGEEPLVVLPTKKGAGRLTLRPEIGWPSTGDVRIHTV